MKIGILRKSPSHLTTKLSKHAKFSMKSTQINVKRHSRQAFSWRFKHLQYLHEWEIGQTDKQSDTQPLFQQDKN